MSRLFGGSVVLEEVNSNVSAVPDDGALITTPYRLLDACEFESGESAPRSSLDVVDPNVFWMADLGVHHNFFRICPDLRKLLTLVLLDGPAPVGWQLEDLMDDDETRLATSLFSSSSGYDDTRDLGGALAGNGGRLDCCDGF
jgi:hypothetical protein